MRLSKGLLLGGLLAFGGSIWLWAYGCDERATQPWPPPELTDYRVWFSALFVTPKLFAYHPLTRQVDSTEIPWIPRGGVIASADGKRLYLVQSGSVVTVVDSDSLNIITELHYSVPITISPDNQLVAFGGDDLYILRTSDYSLAFSDTSKTSLGVFSADSKSFYSITSDSASGGVPRHIYRLDLSDSSLSVTRTFLDVGALTMVLPSPDESKLFFYSDLRLGSLFGVYDVQQDSVIFCENLLPGLGSISITPDGTHAFYTNPGSGWTDPPASSGFTIFDVEANEIEQVVSDIDFFSDSTWVAHPNRMAVTPDGRWLVMLGGSMALRVLYLYDIQGRQLVHREDWGGSGHVFTDLSVQNAK